jgi:transcriptional regulator with XRE-family HTH domain
MAKDNPDSLDVEVGQRVRVFRLERELSQRKLAKRLGVTPQQVQKYESGTSRIGAGRLQAVADILGVPIYDFFTSAGRRLEMTAM